MIQKEYPPARVEVITGIKAADIEALAVAFAQGQGAGCRARKGPVDSHHAGLLMAASCKKTCDWDCKLLARVVFFRKAGL